MKQIFLFGPPLAGKATFLSFLHRSRGAVLSQREGAEGKPTSPLVFGCELEEFRIETISGCPWDIEDFAPLIQQSNAVIFMASRERVWHAEVGKYGRFLEKVLDRRPSVLLISKTDLSISSPLSDEELQLAAGAVGWPTFHSGWEDYGGALASLSWLGSELERGRP